MIHGTEDELIPVEEARENPTGYAASGSL